ncbi:DUF3893 domain-containing protein [Bradyrhizobium diazoefficiens]|uniref:RNaseH domain-containing protein n=1 Tax=Bradyrhizobium sp. TaxID=376 RepID=UPI001B89DC4F|nr:RNaseH domain-containing protein [Bradyrhizobium diazoefficiens]MBR0965787.1 DUF3893 domain-containing protein [Bradyrhizobium diazoefficiens]MBR0975916.1 DUF3893 domain-containing protein [Bradyrhizobium diazoefficiens]MBR1008794.1 DUF3893 domain-containing protein [Bradyrhizobium diazoefficiens]MBR1015064.1 DUF3893 domain-containing protein [Bradyrhizobium diazoefficiens]MBR1052737.1 DUF3893 domain-containing protein [Bradyrhizobium diazoefficiens]
MSDANIEAPFWIRRRVRQTRSLSALRWNGYADQHGATVSLQWTQAAISLLSAIKRRASQSEDRTGRSLPYATLRSLLEARVSGAVVVSPDLGEPWSGKEPRSFLITSAQDPSDVLLQAGRAVGQWSTDVLYRWAERIDIPLGEVDRIRELAADKRVLEIRDSSSTSIDPKNLDALSSFPLVKNAARALLVETLTGRELFDGLGPVYRVVSSALGSNSVEFETWPVAREGGCFSMVCTALIDTAPYSRKPVVRIRASKRVWSNKFPTPNQLFGSSRITLRLMSREALVSVGYEMRLSKGLPATEDIEEPAFLAAMLKSSTDFGADLAQAVSQADPGRREFLSVPYRTAYGRTKIPRGVTAGDQLDLFEKVAQITADCGFEPLPFTEVKKLKRPEEYHSALTTEMLLNHVASEVRLNALDDEQIERLFGQLTGDPGGKDLSAEKVVEAGELLAKVRAANAARLSRTFGEEQPTIVFVSRTEEEGRLFKSAVTTLFPQIVVAEYRLPSGTHGLFSGGPKRYADKFEQRVEAWRELSLAIAAAHSRARVIVQAAKEYADPSGWARDEDVVNKEAGRYALARFAGANVQYLVPRAPGDAYGYLLRLQAATYDLLFAHSGIAPIPSDALKEAFPDPARRPDFLLGVSIVRTARRRRGGNGGALIFAAKVNLSDGKTVARLASSQGTTSWLPFGDALVEVAKLGAADLGIDRTAAIETFQRFVSDTVKEQVAAGERPMVLFDGSASMGLWPWLNNPKISGLPEFGKEQILDQKTWKELTTVRIRTQSSPRLLTIMTHENKPADGSGAVLVDSHASMSACVIKVASSDVGGDYVATHAWERTRKVVRGTSVYRELPGYRRVKKEPERKGRMLYRQIRHAPSDEESSLPESINITVANVSPGSDPDKVASLIACMRHGYAHSAMATSLPAPLSFRSKIADYIARHSMEEELDEPTPSSAEDPISDDSDTPDEQTDALGATFGQLRNALLSGTSLVKFQPSARETLPLNSLLSSATPQSSLDKGKSGKPIEIGQIKDHDQLRRPILALPNFATTEWFKKYIIVSRSHLRIFHSKYARNVRPVVGFPWPQEKPDVEEFYRLLPEIAKYPFGLRFVLSGLFEKMPTWQRRLHQLYIAARREAGLTTTMADDLERRHAQVVQLAEAGKHDVTRAIAILHWGLYNQKTPAMAKLATHDPEIADYIEKFLACDHSLFGELWKRYANNTDEPDIAAAPNDELKDAQVIGDGVEQRPSEDAGSPPPTISSGEQAIDPVRSQEPALLATEVALSVATARWKARLGSIESLAKQNCDLDPNDSVRVELEQLVAELKNDIDAFEAAKPISLPTAELIERLRTALNEVKSVLARAGSMEGEILDNVTTLEAAADAAPPLMSKDRLLASEEGVTRAEASALDTTRAQERLDAANKDLSYAEFLKVAPDLLGRVVETGRTALNDIEMALRGLSERDVTTLPNRPLPSPSSPIVPAAADQQTTHTSEIRSPIDIGDEVYATEFEPAEGDLVLSPLPSAEALIEKAPEPEIDPLQTQIERKADELFTCHEFGLAYHLARAGAKVLGDAPLLPYTVDELRLIAMGERLANPSRYETEVYRESLHACATLAQVLREDDSSERNSARRIALLSAAIPIALLHASDGGSAFAIIDSIKVTGSCSPFFFIVDTLRENRKQGFPLHPSNLRMAVVANAGLSYLNDVLLDIKRQIAAVQAAKFRFVLGQRVKHWLVSLEGPVGALAAKISGPRGAHAAREFAAEYASRDAIHEMLKNAPDLANHNQLIDGAARERLIALVSDLASLCADYSAAAEAAEEARTNSSRIGLVRKLADALIAGIKKFEADTSASSGSDLIDAANRYARKVLRQISDLAEGKSHFETDRGSIGLALHVPLLWLPGMTWASAWTPSPNEASRLLEAIMTMPVPRFAGDSAEALRAAIEARRAEDAFVPARMLLEFAPKFGWDKGRIADEEARLESAEATRKGQLRSRRDHVSSLVTKVRRMALGGLEGSSQLSLSLDTVTIDSERPSITVDFLPEEIEGTRIVDVNAAGNRLTAIENKARRLLDEAKQAFARDIAALADGNKISVEERRELERLLAADDLTTLADWIPMFGAEDQRRPGLAGAVVNEGLHRFLKILGETPNIDLVSASHAVAQGEKIGAFDFSVLDEERREEIESVFRQWFDFKRSMKANAGGLTHIGPRLAHLLTQVAYDTNVVELNSGESQERRGIFAIDAKMELPFDANSLMLPDFGSSTNAGWRIVAAPGTITNAEILARTEGAEPRGVLVLVFGSLSLDRRNQLKLECIKRRRKVLVVDELLLLTMLSARERRPLAMFEIAQAFTTATPYQDYGRSHVPREMFKGRARETANIVNPHGSYIVYGGRRLGKTALLRHISRNRPEHGLFAYVDLVDSSSAALWERASGALKEAFAQPAATSEEFDQGVKAYLKGDERRRILLLLDEADNFIKEQARINHHHVLRLLALMAETNQRFKFVLAGLHNVSRITRSENSPLAQISNDPVRIGPLVEGDVGDAEILVRGPMAALGYEFANREDVWRILSYTNYYPVLIQVFCQGLLQIIEEQTVRNSKIIKVIDGKMVDSAVANSQIRKALYESFDKTITHIEQRYELLTYIIAERALIDAVEGMDGDGLTASEVTERAGRYWPEAFPKGSDPAEVEYLLDEMEGFGILRRFPSGRWTLRSRMLLDLMVTDEEELLARIYRFKGKQPETQFDPKNTRRKINVGKRTPIEKVSPLTDGQEAEIMSPDPSVGQSFVIFGAPISNIDHVHDALETSHTALGMNQRKVQLEVRGWRDRADFISEVRSTKKAGVMKVLVVTSQTEWTPEWVAEASKQPNVAKGLVRPVFIGASKHALAWSRGYPLGTKGLPRTAIRPLRPWARSYVASRLDAINALKSPLVDSVLRLTGGWNDPCQNLFAASGSSSQIEHVGAGIFDGLRGTAGAERFGIPTEMLAAFNTLANWCPDDSSTLDIADVLRDIEEAEVKAILRFGALVGILSIKPDPADPKRELVDMNVLAREILSADLQQ